MNRSAILRIVFFSNFFVGICLVSLYVFFAPFLDLDVVLLLFSAIVVAYSFLKLKGQNKDLLSNAEQMRWLYRHRKLVLLQLSIFGVLGLYAWFRLDFIVPIPLVVALLAFGLYSIIRFKMYAFHWLKLAHALAKIATVALVWALVLSSFLPVNLARDIAVFFLLLALMIPFEIKDIPYDASFETNTLPQLLGISAAKKIGHLCLFLTVVFLFLAHYSTVFFSAWSISCLLAGILIYFTTSTRDELYFLALVDGVMLLPLCFKLIFQWLIN